MTRPNDTAAAMWRPQWTPTGYTNEADHHAGQQLKMRLTRAAEENPTEALRHSVVRTGERPEIPAHVRAAVYMRDGNACCECKANMRGLTKNLDHIVPWSAGGTDKSHNLRTLCPPCNEARSNFVDDVFPRLPVTWWCTGCWTLDTRDHHAWTDHYGEPGWRTKRFLIDPQACDLVLAYCAFCHVGGYTPWPL